MDFNRAKSEIIDWVINFVEQPHPALNDWPPCPYARKARISDRFDVLPGQVDPYTDLADVDLTGKDVVAYVYDPVEILPDQFNDQIDRANKEFLVDKDILAMGDHPLDPEIVNGVKFNQGSYAIVFVQPLAQLNYHARLIADKKYYDNWPETYLQELFRYREDPRS